MFKIRIGNTRADGDSPLFKFNLDLIVLVHTTLGIKFDT